MGPSGALVDELLLGPQGYDGKSDPLDTLLTCYENELPALCRIQRDVTPKTQRMIGAQVGRYTTIFTAAQECVQVYPRQADEMRERVARHLPAARRLLNGDYMARVRYHVAHEKRVSIPLMRLVLDLEHPDYMDDQAVALTPRRLPIAKCGIPGLGAGAAHKQRYDQELVPAARAALHTHISRLNLRGRWGIPGPRSASMSPIAESCLWTKWSYSVGEDIVVSRAARLIASMKGLNPYDRRRMPIDVLEAENDAQQTLRTPAGRAYMRARRFPTLRRVGRALSTTGLPQQPQP